MFSLIILKNFCWLLKMISEHKIQDTGFNMQRIKFHFPIKIFIEKFFDKSLY